MAIARRGPPEPFSIFIAKLVWALGFLTSGLAMLAAGTLALRWGQQIRTSALDL